MGEAFLHGHGSGLRFRSLSVSLPAPHNVFYNGQAIDISHAVIYANLGRSTVKIAPDGCTVSPAIATTGLQSVTVSCKLGGTTRTASIPVTVIAANSVFNNNSWAVIAQAAYYGFAKFIWHVGDEKTETVDGKTHTWRIIGFDHDELSSADAKYNDAGYNRGTKKAALTIQWKTAAGTGTISTSNTSGCNNPWKACLMRTTTLPALLDSMPSELKNNVRTVKKMTYELGDSAGASLKSIHEMCFLPEKLFLLSYFDANYMPPDQLSTFYNGRENISEDQPYEHFAHTWTDLTDYSGYKPGDYLTYDPSYGELTRNLLYITNINVQRRNAWLMKPESAITSTMPKYNYGSISTPYFPVFNF